jgi:hypothetical protein
MKQALPTPPDHAIDDVHYAPYLPLLLSLAISTDRICSAGIRS